MDVNVQAGNWYVVEGDAGDTVTNPLTGRVIATVEDGKQTSFLATTPYVVTSSDSVGVHKANFKSAPAKLKALGLLGGGSSTGLPAGYLVAEFLESTGTQWFNSGQKPERLSTCARWQVTTHSGGQVVSYYKYDNECYSIGQSKNNSGTGGTVAVMTNGSRKFIDIYDKPIGTIFEGEINCDENFLRINTEKKYVSDLGVGFKEPQYEVGVMAQRPIAGSFLKGRVFFVKMWRNGANLAHFIPSLDNSGKPCMFDTVTKKPFYNSGSGQFIVGMDMKQARKLGKLPAGGGSLTVSLPSNYAEDEGVVDALATAQERGWVITIQTYEAETGSASTFSLRRIWVRKVENEQGSYVDTDGARWQVEWCVDIVGADPEQEGYEPFRSVEAAAEYWGLTEYVDPAEENLLTETENNEQE